MKNKISYAHLRITISAVKFICRIIGFWYTINKPIKNKNIIFFPHAQPGSDGYLRRFQEYFSYFNNDGIDYFIADVTTDREEFIAISKGNTTKYNFIRKCLVKRFKQVLKARRYKVAFVQRGLFLYYYDDNSAFFERLLQNLGVKVIVDYWDSVWNRNPALVNNTVKYADSVSVVNDFLYGYFSKIHKKVYLFPIGVNLKRYHVKTDYSIKNNVVFFYTGQPLNVEHFIINISPMLIEIGKKHPYTLRIVSKARFHIKNINVEFFDFDEITFFDLLVHSDIGLYHIEDSEISRGKMAMKVLDYMSAGLPCIASPFGLSPNVVNNDNILLAESNEEWVEKINLLTENKELREKIGRSGRKMVEEHHEISNSYIIFTKILNKSQQNH